MNIEEFIRKLKAHVETHYSEQVLSAVIIKWLGLLMGFRLISVC